MSRRPDTIRTVVLAFVVGLAVTGLTSFQGGDDKPRVLPAEISSQGQWSQAQRNQAARTEG
ncbi:hypothetical protein [Marinobacter zhanjiangensis]|uniref:Uncharacterized protein n=1 Tax=Marinobacter zhanjiangensis TaxID=578215 RepID=A0ABQ3B575_9GAMM|nr:hypothetical protein [Marinobacter zhanjiangensis]GGY73770.1 hypothetical protein GCM10007071_21340 [Marinobacter zhanjiangensis]